MRLRDVFWKLLCRLMWALVLILPVSLFCSVFAMKTPYAEATWPPLTWNWPWRWDFQLIWTWAEGGFTIYWPWMVAMVFWITFLALFEFWWKVADRVAPPKTPKPAAASGS